MRPAGAWLALAVLATLNVALLWPPLPPAVLAGVAFLGLLALPSGRIGAGVAVLVGLAFTTALMAAAVAGGPSQGLGPVRLHRDGALLGLAAALRIAALALANTAAMRRLGPARFVEGLRLPRRATAFVAAVLIAARDLGRDAARLREALVLDDRWPRSRWARARAGARLVAPLAILALRRARARVDALRLAGIRVGRGFAPLVAVTAAAVAGRIALLGLPNVALTYIVVFAGGFLFGWRVGAGAGLMAMALTDFWLTGPMPAAYANAPAMAIVGAAGAAFAWLDPAARRWTGRAAAGAAGFLATLLFSVAADAATWAIVPELRGNADALRALVAAGLAFNLMPAIVNALVFGAALTPLAAARGALVPQSAGTASAVAHGDDGAPAP